MTEADAGTWLDGSRGWANGYRVVLRACREWGWKVPEEHWDDWAPFAAAALGGRYDPILWAKANGDDDGLVKKATEHLQSLAPEGYVFVWDAGELSLIAEWQDCANTGNGCSVQYRSDNTVGRGREVVILCPDHNPCEGHADTDGALASGVGVGESAYCDGSCAKR